MNATQTKARSIVILTAIALLGLLAATGALAVDKTKAEPKPSVKTEQAPLKIVLPNPMFKGTPEDVKSPNLGRTTGKPRPAFLAPADARILSFEKEVSASDEMPIIGELEFITDADKEGSDGSFVEFGPGLQYAQIDLGQPVDIYAIVFWHYHASARIYFDVVVRTADDPDFITNVQTLFNNDHDNSSGLGVGKDKEYIETNDGKLVNGKSTKSRYIRLYSNGNTSNELNHLIEVEVHGKPAK